MGIFENIKKLISDPKPKRRVLCPYCMGEIDTDYDHLEFVCSKHPDEKIEKTGKGNLNPSCRYCQMEYLTTKPMPADFIRCNAPVPEGVEKCDRILPSILLDPEYTVYRISLVGTTSSGKTVFKARLKEEIMSNFMPAFFEYPMVDIPPIEMGKPLPQSTYETDMPFFERPDFIGFRISEKDKNGKTKERKILLIIYDFAGEQVSRYHNDLNSVIALKYQKIMLNSDAIFFLIDPEQNFANHLGNPHWNPDQELGDYHCDMSNVIRDVLTDINTVVAQQQRINPNNEEIKTPKLAYIFTKADKEYITKCLMECNKNAIEAGVSEDHLIWDKDGNPIYTDYSKGVIPNLKEIIQAFIHENDIRYNLLFNPPPFVKNPNDIGYFVCSALGMNSVIGKVKQEIDGKEIEVNGLTKIGPAFRVLDPLYWLLYGDAVYDWENKDGNNQ